jgi:transcriptional regulator with XRE-family HTH domain
MKGHAVDVHVGDRIRQRRSQRGMTQARLAEIVGLTLRQIQKYERGVNRMSSSRLYALARALDVPVSYFFDEMSVAVLSTRPRRHGEGNGPADPDMVFADEKDPMTKRETMQLVSAYYKIKEVRLRKRIFDMIKACAAASSPPVTTVHPARRAVP